MKLLEIVPGMDSDVELETAFLCSAVVEAAVGLALLAECGTSFYLWTGGGSSAVDGTMAAFGLKKLNIIPSFFIFAYLPRCCCAVLQSLVPRWRFSTLVGPRVIPQFTRLPQFGQSAKPSASRTGGFVSMVVSIFAVVCETYCIFLIMFMSSVNGQEDCWYSIQ